MMNENIVVVTKAEYEALTNDSKLVQLTRRYLEAEAKSYADLSLLRFIYGIPAKEGA